MDPQQQIPPQNVPAEPPVAPQPPQMPPPQPVEPSGSSSLAKKLIIGAAVILVIAVIGGGGYFLGTNKNSDPKQAACTMEAKLCPNGTSVGRTGPKCEFSPCPTTTPTPTPTSEYVPGEVLVGLKEGFTAQKAQEIASKVNATIVENSIPDLNFYVFKVNVGEEMKMIELIKNYPEVKYAELNGIIKLDDCNKGPC